MALTPEDVLNKTFTQTQFRRGYDEREVDDFLDDIVAEMRRMSKESDELRGDLDNCRQGKGMAPVAARAVPDTSAKDLEELRSKNATLAARVADLEGSPKDAYLREQLPAAFVACRCAASPEEAGAIVELWFSTWR